ncbi:MAG: helix-turn-helix domain containing protein, partial [Deltaproteobacteria bacterium]|nr:helix-turn-helix domain containing protein [Deltaproteobacteria bacterium]
MKIISDYSDKGVEKVMLVREVILRAVAKVYSWVQAAEILGYSPRHMSRIKKRYEEYGFDGLFDRRTKTGP